MNDLLQRIRSLIDHPTGGAVALIVTSTLGWIFAPALVATFCILWMKRQWVIDGIKKNFANFDERLLLLSFLGIWPFMVLMSGCLPPRDDLFRHMTSYLHDYDYHRLYLYLDPRAPTHSMWIGYEWIAGWLHRNFGLEGGVRIIQTVIYTLTAVSLWKVGKVAVGEGKDAWTWRLLLVVSILMGPMLMRISLGRPEALLGVWAISALWMNPWLWLLIGLVMQPLYWLAAVYVPAAILLKASWRSRIVIIALLGAFSVGFWLWYAGSEWMSFYTLNIDWIHNRRIGVSENMPAYFVIFKPVVVLALILLCWKARPDLRRDWPFLAIIAWFLVPNQVRYLPVICTFLFVFAMRSIPLAALDLKGKFKIWLIALLICYVEVQTPGFTTYTYRSLLPHFTKLPSDARVLNSFNEATYFIPANYPGVHSSPPMEIGATSHEIQSLVEGLSGFGKLDCAKLREAGFTHVVENHLATLEPCLQLEEVSGLWRLWRVR